MNLFITTLGMPFTLVDEVCTASKAVLGGTATLVEWFVEQGALRDMFRVAEHTLQLGVRWGSARRTSHTGAYMPLQ